MRRLLPLREALLRPDVELKRDRRAQGPGFRNGGADIRDEPQGVCGELASGQEGR
jgi:hypothetical protein